MLLRFVAVWGGSFFFNSIALRDLTALTVVESHIDLAAAILLSVLRLRRERWLLARSVWIAFFTIGLLNNVIPFSPSVWDQQHIVSTLNTAAQRPDVTPPPCAAHCGA